MKGLLDACVLYPPILRTILLAAAQAGLYRPLWSPRILEEWARAVARDGPEAEVQARGEIALLQAEWPRATVHPGAATQARLWLPDPNDIHVLAAASDGGADVLITLNLRDFPKREVAAEGVRVLAPDPFLMELWLSEAAAVEDAVGAVHRMAEAMNGAPVDRRKMLRRAHLPRLGKALG